jgi:hypothetical protein
MSPIGFDQRILVYATRDREPTNVVDVSPSLARMFEVQVSRIVFVANATKNPLLLSRNTLQCSEQRELENKQNYELLHIGSITNNPKAYTKRKEKWQLGISSVYRVCKPEEAPGSKPKPCSVKMKPLVWVSAETPAEQSRGCWEVSRPIETALCRCQQCVCQPPRQLAWPTK